MPAPFKRILLIILDSLGAGELPDALEYGDQGASTLSHIFETAEDFRLPNLEQMGIGNIVKLKEIREIEKPEAYFGKMKEKSKGKDTTTGHWEIMGIQLKKPFPTYPNGFPSEIIKLFEKKISKKIIGNYAASGTDIIEKSGVKHLEYGYPIVYTSADSVFQIAAHKSICSLEKL
jgi:phosphopentomutase